MAQLLNAYIMGKLKVQLRWRVASLRYADMKVRYLGFTAVAAFIVVALFVLVSLEGKAGVAAKEQVVPYHLYKLQYSYDGRVWHDLIAIKDGTLLENRRYLRQDRKFPRLRYWHSYLDEDGERRLDYIPLTIGG
jgi:hypothetical protein